jgi:hypothetical protein
MAQIVARLVGAKLRELSRKTPVWGAVETHDEPLHDLPGNQLDAAQLRERLGIQQIRS